MGSSSGQREPPFQGAGQSLDGTTTPTSSMSSNTAAAVHGEGTRNNRTPSTRQGNRDKQSRAPVMFQQVLGHNDFGINNKFNNGIDNLTMKRRENGGELRAPSRGRSRNRSNGRSEADHQSNETLQPDRIPSVRSGNRRKRTAISRPVMFRKVQGRNQFGKENAFNNGIGYLTMNHHENGGEPKTTSMERSRNRSNGRNEDGRQSTDTLQPDHTPRARPGNRRKQMAMSRGPSMFEQLLGQNHLGRDNTFNNGIGKLTMNRHGNGGEQRAASRERSRNRSNGRNEAGHQSDDTLQPDRTPSVRPGNRRKQKTAPSMFQRVSGNNQFGSGNTINNGVNNLTTDYN